MRVLFFQYGLAVPPRAGADLHTTKVAEELQKRGHDVRYLCFELQQEGPLPFPVEAVSVTDEADGGDLRLTATFRNLMRYWATSPARLSSARRAVVEVGFDVCIATGIHGLLLLHQLEDRQTIWYAGDELTVGILSQLAWANGVGRNRKLLAEAARVLLFTRMSRDVPNETWVVARRDARSMRRIMGRRNVSVIENGVDTERYRPIEGEVGKRSAIFWGRLDFGPNEQAVRFLVQRVWPLVREIEPQARLIVMGFAPSKRVLALAAQPGVELIANAPDIRPLVCSAPIALYPFSSGTGIKNKLLEGAAMERALLVSPTAVDGLSAPEPNPWRVCGAPRQWRDELIKLWGAPAEARELGRAARAWVAGSYSWSRAGALAEASVQRVVGQAR